MIKNLHSSTNHPRKQSMRTVFLFKHAIPALLLLSGLITTSVSAFDQPQVYTLKPKQRVMILGDSTQAEGTAVAGHIRLADQAQREQLPDQDITITGVGWAQHTASSLTQQIDQFVKISQWNKVVPDYV
jgi:glutamate dehydrogenase/leucine dehydrogenase